MLDRARQSWPIAVCHDGAVRERTNERRADDNGGGVGDDEGAEEAKRRQKGGQARAMAECMQAARSGETD